ncbi:MAG: IS66 family insertion sequence element accessory protein TnpB [Pseudohongiellaceae bacterium]
MLSLSAQTAVFIAVTPVDFRLGMDGLAQRCRAVLTQDPMSGAAFLFCNRKRTAIKLITYDGQGYCLYHKRLATGKLSWWPTTPSVSYPIPVRELHVLLHNGHPKRANMAQDWRRLT